MTTLLAALVMQAPANLIGFYTGMPGLSNSAGLSLTLQSHSVTVQLYHRTASTTTLTVIKNNTGKAATIGIAIPNHVRRAGTMGAAQGADIEASWDRKPVSVSITRWSRSVTKNALVDADGAFILPVKVNANATHSLQLSWRGDLLTSGMGGKNRSLAYDVSNASDWDGVGQFRYSIQYQTCDLPGATIGKGSPVFAVESTVPSRGWQIGDKGAYLSGIPAGVDTLWFNYHPNGFAN